MAGWTILSLTLIITGPSLLLPFKLYPAQPIKARDRLGNCTLGPFSITAATKFCCTYQILVAKGLLLGVGAAAPTPFHVKRPDT
jgi:hypothetical protein